MAILFSTKQWPGINWKSCYSTSNYLPRKNSNPQSKLKSWFWDSFPPLYPYWPFKVTSGCSSSGYLIVSTCDTKKLLENLMFRYLHLPKKSTNRQSNLKYWFWSSFPPLYLYWTLKVSSGYSSSAYLIVSTCDMRKLLENLMFRHLVKGSWNPDFWIPFHLYTYSYWTLKVSCGYCKKFGKCCA